MLKHKFPPFSSANEPKAKINTTQFYHPDAVTTDAGGGKDSPVQFFMQVGGTKYPVHPIGPQDAAQLYLNLVKSAGKLGSTLESIGISLDEFLNLGDADRKLFVLSCDLEKVLEAG